MAAASPAKRLLESLRRLEGEAGQPVVPGETSFWCTSVDARLDVVAEDWRRDREEQEELLAQVVERDPGQAARVERSEAKADGLGETLESLRARVEKVRERDRADPTGSAESLRTVRRLRDDLIEWIVSMRAFQAELRTWLAEASYRDRGVVD